MIFKGNIALRKVCEDQGVLKATITFYGKTELMRDIIQCNFTGSLRWIEPLNL